MSEDESEVVIKEEPEADEEMNHDDKDIVTTNSEMVLDDILGDDIIGETSDQEMSEGRRKKITAPDQDSNEGSPKRSS